jgi:hypothetical protein
MSATVHILITRIPSTLHFFAEWLGYVDFKTTKPLIQASKPVSCPSFLLYINKKEIYRIHTVRKMDLILRSIERRPQMQFSIARRFMLQLLRRYCVRFCKMRNFTLGAPCLGKLKNTGGRRTNNLWIYCLQLHHCATVTCETEAISSININIFRPI